MTKKINVSETIEAVKAAETQEAVEELLKTVCTKAQIAEICETLTGSKYEYSLSTHTKSQMAYIVAWRIKKHRENVAFQGLTVEDKYADLIAETKDAVRIRKVSLCEQEELEWIAIQLGVLNNIPNLGEIIVTKLRILEMARETEELLIAFIASLKTARTDEELKTMLMTCTEPEMVKVYEKILGKPYPYPLYGDTKDELAERLTWIIMEQFECEEFPTKTYDEKINAILNARCPRQEFRSINLLSSDELKEFALSLGLKVGTYYDEDQLCEEIRMELGCLREIERIESSTVDDEELKDALLDARKKAIEDLAKKVGLRAIRRKSLMQLREMLYQYYKGQ